MKIFKKSQLSGFTLIELLVVIAIIALLLGVLVPSLKRAKDHARDIVCQSNLRQAGTCYEMYLNDNRNLYPTSCRFVAAYNGPLQNCWYKVLLDYIGDFDEKFFVCPTSTQLQQPDAQMRIDPKSAFDASDPVYGFHEDLPLFSYGQNDWILSAWDPSGTQPYHGFGSKGNLDLAWRTNLVKGVSPSQVPVLGDASYPIATDVRFYPIPPTVPEYGDHHWTRSTVAGDQMKRFCLDRHRLSVNWIFMDCSVRKVGLKQLWTLKFHRNWNPNGWESKIQWKDWMRDSKEY